MTTYNKTKNEDFNAEQLQTEINVNSAIVPSCLSITSSGDDLALEFAADLSGAEETELDTVIANHVPDVEVIEATQLPLSDIDSNKLSVHPTYKPRVAGGSTYAVWTGAGDDVQPDPNDSVLGEGELLHFDAQQGTPEIIRDIKFDHTAFGRVWIHEAYLQFSGAGDGDYITADVMGTACPLQQSINLDLVLDGDLVKYSQGGPGTGTHGFAGSPTLLPRTFSQDGDWDYDGVSLTPNFAGTGGYQISQVDTSVHRYVNKIPLQGESPFFSMSSDETAELLPGYFLRVTVANVSDTNWHLSVIMEIYRERTVDP
jgi:hypothetical protein